MFDPLRHVSAAILAGGLGTRLRPVVDDRPKALAPVRGRPYLCFVLDQLQQAGLKEVVLLTGHRADQIVEAFGDSYRGMRLVYSTEPQPLGTAGAVRNALSLFAHDAVLVLNGDSFCEVDLAAFASAPRRGDAGLVLARAGDVSRFGQVVFDERCLIRQFDEKRGSGPGWINAGVYLLRRDWVAGWPTGRLSLEGDVLPACVAAGRAWCYPCDGDFLDVGTPESFAESHTFFATRV